MELNESEKQTILRALSFYRDTVKFTLRNRQAKRSVKDFRKFADLYEQDLKNIADINSRLGG